MNITVAKEKLFDCGILLVNVVSLHQVIEGLEDMKFITTVSIFQT